MTQASASLQAEFRGLKLPLERDAGLQAEFRGLELPRGAMRACKPSFSA
ncbi:hypothetical protein [Paenibacillus sp. 1011MAR3C5]|nr:hypothetical protein [Paenibacillus sp. 1011MAR3C5]